LALLTEWLIGDIRSSFAAFKTGTIPQPLTASAEKFLTQISQHDSRFAYIAKLRRKIRKARRLLGEWQQLAAA
jgi:hypothetical protein